MKLKNFFLRLKQLFCRHKKMVENKYTQDIDGFPYVVETVTKCEKCGKVKHDESYGTIYIENWKKTGVGKMV